ncbi:beta-lactamase [Coccidioides immitis RMSCC 3703]|uniref:Beta-lactamase n=1 Tax=Coccidioides immitis RMSCC 3703 TaxID=454286 RepID=A0A0J8QPW8_COCIT|nr:beta-lactamase [Coccidioides immitis RMSCC 3703]
MTRSKSSAQTDLFSRLEELLSSQPSAAGTSPCSASTLLVELGTPSVSIAVLDKGEIHSRCITSLYDNELTRFQSGSISKAIASLAVFKLIELGKLSLHGSIAQYLPTSLVRQLETAHTAGLSQHITIAQLLSHTSGLEPDGVFGFLGYEESSDGETGLPDLRTIIAGEAPCNTLRIKLADYPGHRFSYSGGGLTVLQMIVEQVLGKPFSTVMREYLFDPLEMTRSTFEPPGPGDINGLEPFDHKGEGNYARPYYSGHTPCETTHRVNPEQAAAGLWSTPEDLLKAGRAILRSLNGEPDAFLNQALARTILTEVQNGVAHSWFVAREPPWQVFRHAGSNMPGCQCHLICFANDTGSASPKKTYTHQDAAVPGEGCGIAIMTNSVEGVATYSKVLFAACYLLGWPAPPKPREGSDIVIPFADTHTKVDPQWIGWEGHWDGGWELFEGQDGAPFARLRGMAAVSLYVAARPRSMAEMAKPRGERSVDLVCSGLEIMFRLMTDGRERVIEIWHGGQRDRRRLQRADIPN